MNPCAGTADLLVFEARPFSHLGIPPKNTVLISSRVLLYTKMQDLGSEIFDFFQSPDLLLLWQPVHLKIINQHSDGADHPGHRPSCKNNGNIFCHRNGDHQINLTQKHKTA